MPADIRNFFGGKGGQASQESVGKQIKPKSRSKTEGRSKRKIVDDSDEEDQPSPKPSTKPQTKRRKDSPVAEEVTTSDYFASKGKANRNPPAGEVKATPSKPTPASRPNSTRKAGAVKNKMGSPSPVAPSSGRSTRVSTRKAKANTERTTYKEISSSEYDTIQVLKQDDESADDIYGAEYKPNGKTMDDYETEEGADVSNSRIAKGRGKKGKSSATLDDEGRSENVKKSNTRKSTPTKKAAKKPRTPAKKKAEEPEDAEIKQIFDSIPTVKAPTPPPRDVNQKFDFKANAARSQPAPNAGAKEIPEGAENCLTGLTFVFTGVLDALGREEGQELVKRYGGKVTTSPSSRTDYVVLGTDAGPKKLEVIKKNGIQTINEDGLFALIRTLPAHGGSGKAALKAEEKRQAEEKKIQLEAEEQEKQLADELKKKEAANGGKVSASSKTQPSLDDQLWTVKYAPTQLNQICGNKVQVERLQTWLKNWHKNAKSKFKKGGPDGSGTYRAVMIHGAPGIGKTTAAHLVAQLEGYDIVESNASDTRSKKLIDNGLKGVLDTTSLLGYFASEGQKVESTRRRLVLIMDEVDGMSAGDRGGVGAMAAVCRKTSVPIILICNERRQPKMKPFDHVTYDLPFRKPTTDQVRGRIMTILFREGISKMIPTQIVNSLIEGSGADIRRIINMVSTAKLNQQAMDFDHGKKMTNAWEKNVILKPWDITQKILGGGLFAQSSKATLNQKAELYFNDHEFSFLMLQENYLFPNPILAHPYEGKKKNLKTLELVDQAAESISDGDLVDSLIHGPQQHWSLMPAHAIFSFVRPASFVSGSTAGNRVQFTSWLGNHSKQGKLSRFVKEIQAHMRLRTSGDRHEIRQQYLPLLWTQLVRKLELHGSEPQCLDDVIKLMDSYFITKEDWEAIMELGVGPHDMDRVKLSTQVKSNFTRKYNAMAHPLPFMKASGAPPPTVKAKEKPDLEEAIEESDDDVLLDLVVEGTDGEGELDLKKDKYVQAPKKRKAAPKKSGKNADIQGQEDNSDEEPPSKRPRGKGKTAGKASKSKGSK